MKSGISLPAIALALLGVLVATLPVAAQELAQQNKKKHHQYQLVDISALGGRNYYLPFAARSLSAAGTFAGAADTAIPDPYAPVCFNDDCLVGHAVPWRGGALTDLGALPGAGDLSSAANWISTNGLIAGFSENGEIDPLVPGFPVSTQ